MKQNNISKLQFRGRGIINENVVDNLDVKHLDGKIVHYCCGVDDVLYVYKLMDYDEELGYVLNNDIEFVKFAEYNEI